MKVYLNSNNGIVTVTHEPLPQATLIPVEEVFTSAKKKYQEVVSAEVEQALVFHQDLKIATFNGLAPSSESDFGIEFCEEHEAHDIHTLEQARAVWGLDEELFPLI